MREETERMEGVDAGTAILAGNKYEKIFSSASQLLSDQRFYDTMSSATNPYGDGKTSQRILEIVGKSQLVEA
jgi:UDP-N-acetylglucosamine 2-epimerase (non-hydrolysing)